jgi:hypothetical protein
MSNSKRARSSKPRPASKNRSKATPLANALLLITGRDRIPSRRGC